VAAHAFLAQIGDGHVESYAPAINSNGGVSAVPSESSGCHAAGCSDSDGAADSANDSSRIGGASSSDDTASCGSAGDLAVAYPLDPIDPVPIMGASGVDFPITFGTEAVELVDVHDDVVQDVATGAEEKELAAPQAPLDRAFPERELSRTVRVLSAGRWCKDWAVMRMGHITGASACRVGAFAQRFLSSRSSGMQWCVELVRLLDWMCRSWFQGHPTYYDMREAHACIRDWLQRDRDVRAVWSVGMVENRRYRHIAASADAIVELVHGNSLHDSLSDSEVVPVKFHPIVDWREVQMYREFRAHLQRRELAPWVVCTCDDRTFHEAVPNPRHRIQVLHYMATYESRACIYVPAAHRATPEDGILYKVLVLPSAAVHNHVALMNAVASPLLSWLFVSDPELPRHLPIEHAALLRSHHRAWWMLRRHVLSNGPVPPVRCMWNAWIVLHNTIMGAVDASDRGQTWTEPGKVADWTNWGGACLASFIQHTVFNASRLYRCSKVVEDVGREPLHLYKRRLRHVESMREFLWRAGLELIKTGGEQPAFATPPAPPRAEPANPENSPRFTGDQLLAEHAAAQQAAATVRSMGTAKLKSFFHTGPGITLRKCSLMDHQVR